MIHLVDLLLPSIDAFGLSRMQLNVLVLQQTLKQLSPSSSLTRVAEFYVLGEKGCDAVVNEGVKVQVSLWRKLKRSGVSYTSSLPRSPIQTSVRRKVDEGKSRGICAG